MLWATHRGRDGAEDLILDWRKGDEGRGKNIERRECVAERRKEFSYLVYIFLWTSLFDINIYVGSILTLLKSKLFNREWMGAGIWLSDVSVSSSSLALQLWFFCSHHTGFPLLPELATPLISVALSIWNVCVCVCVCVLSAGFLVCLGGTLQWNRMIFP